MKHVQQICQQFASIKDYLSKMLHWYVVNGARLESVHPQMPENSSQVEALDAKMSLLEENLHCVNSNLLREEDKRRKFEKAYQEFKVLIFKHVMDDRQGNNPKCEGQHHPKSPDVAILYQTKN